MGSREHSKYRKMIEFIEGLITEKAPTHIVINCNGVGYIAQMSLFSYSQFPDVGSKTKVLMHQVIREDTNLLYGFYTDTERRVFRQLITVNGIGVNTARMMLSAMSPSELVEAIISQNLSLLQSIKGIGIKTAQRVVIELKDKLDKNVETGNILTIVHNTNKEQALTALVHLGFSKVASDTTLNKILKTDSNLSVEDLIKLALKML